MTKKVLSALLAVAMLLSFAAIATAYDTAYEAYLPEQAQEIAALNEAAELQEQGRALITATADTLGSGSFYLRGSSTLPADHNHLFDLVPSPAVPIAFAADDGQLVFEQNVNWGDVLGGFQGFLFRVIFGNRMRMVVNEDEARIIFPGRRFFFNLTDLGEDLPVFNFEDFDLTGLGEIDIPTELPVERAGNYIRVTLDNDDGGYTHFFYRSSLLRRIVTEMPDGSVTVMEIDSLSGNPPESLFSTGWMLYIPLGWFVRLFNA
ncbi:MAG: hypothetical protein FWE40_01445 [Oscillospiraceae bacterium]|jgi:hypothetical protein|nr:hypothetical protein [Oscillospiraceae bacterium]